MTDPVAVAARAAAARLGAQHGPGLAAEVEAALHSRDSDQRPGQFLDPVSLGTLIVAIATLAWTVYADLRKRTPSPRLDIVARQVRIELRQRGETSEHDTDQLTSIVVTEIVQAAHDDTPGDGPAR